MSTASASATSASARTSSACSRELGAETPFPIQAATIPDVLAGRDVLGRGRTGSGKTIAFGAPLVERLLQLRADQSPNQRREFGRAPQALILAPTRELALQIDRTVQPIARSVGLFTTQIYGGVPYARQLGALQRGVDIIIGTPGRVQDLVNQGKLNLSKVIITVLDEADHMAELGFLEPVQDILNHTQDGGQKLLFSATLDRGVADIVEQYLVEPAVFEVAGEDQDSSTIEHVVLLMDQRDKQQVLIELASGPGKKLVFARTRAFAEMLADVLDDAGIRAESIHGDLNQSRRTRALEKFTSGRVDALVATDVAARGIHVDDIALVIQADAPDEYKAYLHRSGRTGRAGKEGLVVTLVPRNRRRRTEELLARADITAEWISVAPGEPILAELARARPVEQASWRSGDRQHRRGDEREPEPDPLHRRDPLLEHDRGERDGARRVERGQHRDDAEVADAEADQQQRVGDRSRRCPPPTISQSAGRIDGPGGERRTRATTNMTSRIAQSTTRYVMRLKISGQQPGVVGRAVHQDQEDADHHARHGRVARPRAASAARRPSRGRSRPARPRRARCRSRRSPAARGARPG